MILDCVTFLSWQEASRNLLPCIDTQFFAQQESLRRLNFLDDSLFFGKHIQGREATFPLYKQLSIYTVSLECNEKVTIFRGDITKLKVDAIVNAARPSLLGGGGVDGKIHSEAGPNLKELCRPLGPIKHGEIRVTESCGNIRSKWIIHAVGPTNDLHDAEAREELLTKVYSSCLEVITLSQSNDNEEFCKLNNSISFENNSVRSIAFSCISVGAYRCPLRECTHIALRTMRNWLQENLKKVDEIWLIPYTELEYKTILELFPIYFPTSPI